MGTYEVGKESRIKQNADSESPDAVGLDDFHSVTPAGQLQENNIPLAGLKELIIDGPLNMPTDSIADKRLLEIRKKYRRAYEPWSDEEDEWLLRSHEEKQNTTLLAEALQRQPSAIKSRI